VVKFIFGQNENHWGRERNAAEPELIGVQDGHRKPRCETPRAGDSAVLIFDCSRVPGGCTAVWMPRRHTIDV
jgi:hypothetical protein